MQLKVMRVVILKMRVVILKKVKSGLAARQSFLDHEWNNLTEVSEHLPDRVTLLSSLFKLYQIFLIFRVVAVLHSREFWLCFIPFSYLFYGQEVLSLVAQPCFVLS